MDIGLNMVLNREEKIPKEKNQRSTPEEDSSMILRTYNAVDRVADSQNMRGANRLAWKLKEC